MKPNRKEYFTDEGLHHAMESWARSQDKQSARAEVVFVDGSIFTDTFHRAKRLVKYKTHDGLTYWQDVDSSMFSEPYFSDNDVTLKELKTGFENWIKRNNPLDSIISIKWSKSFD